MASISTRHPDNPFHRATLEFEVVGDTVTIADVVIDATGREERGRNTLRTDGKEHYYGHGYVVTARWLGSHGLEAVVMRDGKVAGRVQYQLSPDGNALTLSAGEYIGVFDRA